jgi:hypothetical protein
MAEIVHQSTTSAVIGNNTVTFNALAAGPHTNCTITVTDNAMNVSNILDVNDFTIDLTAPVPLPRSLRFQIQLPIKLLTILSASD